MNFSPLLSQNDKDKEIRQLKPIYPKKSFFFKNKKQTKDVNSHPYNFQNNIRT